PKDRPDPVPNANGPNANGPGLTNNPPVTFRNNPLSFRNNPNLWRNNQILRNNADRPGALAGHYGIKGTSDFLAAGAGEALAEILIKGAFDGDWSTSWSTFVGAGISSQVEATLTDTALNSGAELRHIIDKLRNQPPTVSADTGDTGDTRDSDTRDTADSSRTQDGDGPDRTGGPSNTDLTGGAGAPRTSPTPSSLDSPPPYTSQDPPLYSTQDPPPYSPGSLPATAAENALWQQVHNGPADVREQALHDIAALRGTQAPGNAEIDVRDSLHGNLSQVPEVRVVPTGDGPAVQVDADEVRRALDGFGTPTTVEDSLGGRGSQESDVSGTSDATVQNGVDGGSTSDVTARNGVDGGSTSDVTAQNGGDVSGSSDVTVPNAGEGKGTSDGIVQNNADGTAEQEAPSQVGGNPVASNGSQPAPGTGNSARAGGAPATGGTQTPSGSQPQSTRTPDATAMPEAPQITQDASAQPPVTSETSASTEIPSSPTTTHSSETVDSTDATGTSDSSSENVLTPHAGITDAPPKVNTTGSYADTGDVSKAPPLTIVVSDGAMPGEGSPEAADLLERAGTDRAVVLGPAVTPDGAGRPVRAAVELTREGPGAPVRVRPLTGPAPALTQDHTTVTTETAFPGADILLPLADALGAAPRPATQSTATTDGAPVSTT
ncbi:hypothetical protein DMH25_46990, partial [Streptomyces sp. WAC 01325]|uniref:hypothetical protein n=1 Tax=Streptomyces sp. WAC 01325 TaxID=2203202 RepID=UPI0010039E89